MAPVCQHKNVVVLARRDGVDYVECTDCKKIFEDEELEATAASDDDEED